MDAKDISKIKDFCLRYFSEIPSGLKLENGNIMTEGDVIAAAYYKAVVALLVSKGLLKDGPELELKFIETDSNTPEEDYL